MTTSATPSPQIVSREEWLRARQEHLAQEKEFTRRRDQLSRQRRQLPWVKVEKEYLFSGADGRQTLNDLFGTKQPPPQRLCR